MLYHAKSDYIFTTFIALRRFSYISNMGYISRKFVRIVKEVDVYS